jgi:ATP-binding cassette subfamily C protein
MAEVSKDAIESRLLRTAVGACRRHIAFVIVFSAALNLLYLAPSIYMLQIYDRVLTSGGLLTLFYLSIVLVGCLAVLSYLDHARMRLLLVMAKRFDRLVAPHVLLAALQREGRRAAGQAHVLREFDTLRAALSGPPAIAAVDAPWTPIYIGVCFLIHPWIGTLALGGGAVLVGLAFVNHRSMHRLLRTNDQSTGAVYALQMSDSAQNETARALGMQGALVARQMRAREAMTSALTDSGRANAIYASSTKFARLVLQSAALGLGAYLALQQQISAGAIIAASILTARAFAPLELIVGAWRQFEQGRQAYRTLNQVLLTLDGSRDHTALPAPRGVLSVESVTIRAPDSERFIVFNASFQAEPGDIVGVVGPSGAGKTTLLRAVAGAILPDGGAVRLDGAKLSDWSPDQLGAHIGYVPQDLGLFTGSVRDNIARFNTSGARRKDVDQQIVAAAVAAGVHDLILALPQAYDTEIGPNGRGLSTGQAQRVALARALFGDPVLLALDEPNAHLDSDGEAALVATLRAASKRGVCSVVVAHRAGFLTVANKLLVLKDGRVEAFGPREEITAKLNPAAGPRPVTLQSISDVGARS